MTAVVRHYNLSAVKKCISCLNLMPRSAFYSSAYTTNQGKRSVRTEPRCKCCSRERRKADYWANLKARKSVAAAYKIAHKDEIKQQSKTHRATTEHKLQKCLWEKRRRAQGSVPIAVHRDLVERALNEARFGDRYLDAYSGELIESPQIDHIVPLKLGGVHAYENLCVTSGSNNSSKGSRPFLLWMAAL